MRDDLPPRLAAAVDRGSSPRRAGGAYRRAVVRRAGSQPQRRRRPRRCSELGVPERTPAPQMRQFGIAGDLPQAQPPQPPCSTSRRRSQRPPSARAPTSAPSTTGPPVRAVAAEVHRVERQRQRARPRRRRARRRRAPSRGRPSSRARGRGRGEVVALAREADGCAASRVGGAAQGTAGRPPGGPDVAGPQYPRRRGRRRAPISRAIVLGGELDARGRALAASPPRARRRPCRSVRRSPARAAACWSRITRRSRSRRAGTCAGAGRRAGARRRPPPGNCSDAGRRAGAGERAPPSARRAGRSWGFGGYGAWRMRATGRPGRRAPRRGVGHRGRRASGTAGSVATEAGEVAGAGAPTPSASARAMRAAALFSTAGPVAVLAQGPSGAAMPCARGRGPGVAQHRGDHFQNTAPATRSRTSVFCGWIVDVDPSGGTSRSSAPPGNARLRVEPLKTSCATARGGRGRARGGR